MPGARLYFQYNEFSLACDLQTGPTKTYMFCMQHSASFRRRLIQCRRFSAVIRYISELQVELYGRYGTETHAHSHRTFSDDTIMASSTTASSAKLALDVVKSRLPTHSSSDDGAVRRNTKSPCDATEELSRVRHHHFRPLVHTGAFSVVLSNVHRATRFKKSNCGY